VDDSGDVTFGGTGLVAFPRPAFDSGSVPIDPGDNVIVTHDLGGDEANYVIDLTCNAPAAAGRQNLGVGGWREGTSDHGIWYDMLTNTNMWVHRGDSDWTCDRYRVRIWVYPDP
jgi:hypothetical protein